ncbi:MAG TPA: hypothetical protein VHM90_15075 [Phycisphaerae bacterium]|nr:hypothetical protein [Phycisphaerae bacterium]
MVNIILKGCDMSSITTDIHIRGLARKQFGQITQKAKRLGLTPEKYIKKLVEQDLAISHAARTKSFQELLGPGTEVDDAELDQLIDKARTAHHRQTTQRKR